MKICTKSLKDTKRLANIFAGLMSSDGAFVSLFGDLGAGKTALVRCILKELDVKENITSPSFVILNEYKARLKEGILCPVYHFDLYRLEKEGVKTIDEELREYSRNGVLTFVEWAQYGSDCLPYDRMNIKVSYKNTFDDERCFEFEAIGQKYEFLISKINDEWNK